MIDDLQSSIAAAGLPVVAWFTERIPVGFIPEQAFITPVRNDVVDNGCRCQPAFVPALLAKRM